MPTIPPEGTYTDAERRFIANQPPGLWPENQDSAFGQLRRVLTDEVQINRDKVDSLAQELFISTASQYLSLWEEELGVAIAPSGKTVAQRRAVLLSRLKHGASTRALRDAIVAEFVSTTFGQPSAFTLAGIPLTAGGIPLYGDLADPSTLYRIYEDPSTFSYLVRIKNTNTPDINALARELTRITPAGISFTIDNSLTNILDYQRAVLSDRPTSYWPLVTTSGTGNPWQSIAGAGNILTPESSPTNVSALIQNGGGVVGDTQARSFDGVDDALDSPDVVEYGFGAGPYSLEAWVKFTALPTTGNRMDVLSLGGDIYAGRGRIGVMNAGAGARWSFGAAYQTDPVLIDAEPGIDTPVPVTGTTYHIVGTWTGQRARFYVNGVKVVDVAYNITNPKPFTGLGVKIGRYWHFATAFVNGVIDEPAVYGYALSDAQVLAHYKTGINVP